MTTRIVDRSGPLACTIARLRCATLPGFSPRVSLEVQEPDLVPLAVASGAGVAVVGSNHVADRTFAGVESRPLAATEPLTSVLVEWVDDGATRQAVEFVEVLVELAHNTPRHSRPMLTAVG